MPRLLSIVVPTYKRQELIPRQIEFWSNEPHDLIILDGSPNQWEPPKSLTTTDGEVRFRYVHRPTPIEERLRFSISLIETPFVALLSDDEFFIPSALGECVEFLKANPDYASCKGGAVGFRVQDGQPQLRRVYKNLPGLRIEADDGRERMRRHLSPYAMASLWSVQQRKIYEACVKSLGNPPFESAAAPEVAISLINAYLGKIVVLNSVMWLRSYEYKNIWWQAGPISFDQWWLKADPNEAARFVLGIQNACGEVGESQPATSDIHGALNEYCRQQNLVKRVTRRQVMKRTNVLDSVVLVLKVFLQKYVKAFRLGQGRKSARTAKWRSVVSVLDDLEADGIAVDRDQVILALDFVQMWHHSNDISVSHH